MVESFLSCQVPTKHSLFGAYLHSKDSRVRGAAALSGFISVLISYLLVAETESPLLSVMYHCSVQHREKWDCRWHTNFGPGFGLRKSAIRRFPQELHLPALLSVFHLCYFVISFIIFQYMQMLCVFPWVLYALHNIRSSYTKYMQDWAYHAIIVLFCFVESFSFLKINRILLFFVGSIFFSFTELYLMKLFFVMRILLW